MFQFVQNVQQLELLFHSGIPAKPVVLLATIMSDIPIIPTTIFVVSSIPICTAKDGWYIDPTMDHYWCYHSWIPEMKVVRNSITAKFFPTHAQMSNYSPTDELLITAQELTNAYEKSLVSVPLSTKHHDALVELTNIFNYASSSPSSQNPKLWSPAFDITTSINAAAPYHLKNQQALHHWCSLSNDQIESPMPQPPTMNKVATKWKLPINNNRQKREQTMPLKQLYNQCFPSQSQTQHLLTLCTKCNKTLTLCYQCLSHPYYPKGWQLPNCKSNPATRTMMIIHNYKQIHCAKTTSFYITTSFLPCDWMCFGNAHKTTFHGSCQRPSQQFYLPWRMHATVWCIQWQRKQQQIQATCQ